MKNNRGMSLVELLITVTILALVIVGASTFMLTGSRSFAKGSADSKVQSEAELAVNQIEDLVIDVNGGVDYVVDDAANTESLIMYHTEPDTSGVSVFKKRTVTWDKSDDKNMKLISSEWNVTQDPATGAYVDIDPPVYSNQLLAEHVTDFNVDLSDIIKETAKDGTEIDIVRSVVIRVDCLDGSGKAAYATTPIITLRNRMMLSGSPETIFDNTPTADDNLLLYISNVGMEAAVPIRDRVTTVERGKMYNIYAMVNAGTNVNSLCDWEVKGESSGELSSLNFDGVFAVLDVNISEPNDYLVITASYKNNPSKKAVGIVKVIGGNSKSLDWLKIVPLSQTAYNPKYDSDHGWAGDYNEEDEAQLQYKWSVDQPDIVESFVSDQKTLELVIIKKPENYNKVLKITLVLHAPTTGQTLSASTYYIIPPEGTLGGDSLVERGKRGEIGYHGDNWYSFTSPFYTEDIRGECYFCDAYGNRISAYDYLLDRVVLQVGHTNYYLTLKEDLPPENEYYIKVIIYYHNTGDVKDSTGAIIPDWQYSRIMYIPAVSIWGKNLKLSPSVLQSGFNFTYDITGYYERSFAGQDGYSSAYEYEVVELNCDIPDGYTVTPKFTLTVPRTNTEIESRCEFDVVPPNGDWSKFNEIKLKSMVIKISLKDHPSIYTYINVTFA